MATDSVATATGNQEFRDEMVSDTDSIKESLDELKTSKPADVHLPILETVEASAVAVTFDEDEDPEGTSVDPKPVPEPILHIASRTTIASKDGKKVSHHRSLFSKSSTEAVGPSPDELKPQDLRHLTLTWVCGRTKLECHLLLTTLFLFTIFLIVAIILAVQTTADFYQKANVCTRPECIRTAAQVLENIDPTVKPCQDFYKYACGVWNKKHIIPEDLNGYNRWSEVRENLQITLKDLLESPILGDEATSVRQVKNLYKSCLDTKMIESRGSQMLTDWLEQFGGWPVINPAWEDDHFNWVEVAAKLRIYNTRILVNDWVSADMKNSSVNIIQFDEPPLGIPSRAYYMNKDKRPVLEAYQEYAVELAVLLGASRETAVRDMEKVIEFEIKLAHLTQPPEQHRDRVSLYKKTNLNELTEGPTGHFNWSLYLDLVYKNVSIKVLPDTPIVIYANDFYENLPELVSNTSMRTVSNYMLLRFIMYEVTSMPAVFLNLRLKFFNALYGVSAARARWQNCVTYAVTYFGMAVGRLFVEKHFTKEMRSNAVEMVDNIRDTFIEIISNVKWMNQAARAVAKEKAAAIVENIGYPEFILNNTQLNNEYNIISLNESEFFESILLCRILKAQKNLLLLNQSVDRKKWDTDPVTVNAFYQPATNRITFPAAIFQPPFYVNSSPKSFDYGGIGMVIGHEITHGFDNKGRLYDKFGNQRSWWEPMIVKAFNLKAQCIIKQYNEYWVREVNKTLNGVNTEGENIADNGGLKQAFLAYRKWVARQGHEEEPLPGIDLNHNQLFFLNFAQIWCGTSRPEKYRKDIATDKHSPGKFRVHGSLANSVDFAKAFNCPEGSPMNPYKKCEVW